LRLTASWKPFRPAKEVYVSHLSPAGWSANAGKVVGGHCMNLAALRRVFIRMGHLCKKLLLNADEALQAE
jgi:hypothetical protein